MELKYLASYLPYHLKGVTGDHEIVICGLNINHQYIQNICNDNTVRFDQIKPLLLPLSALTEPMEDGSVPIVELAKLAFPNHIWYLNRMGTHAVCDTGRLVFEFDDAYNIFLLDDSANMIDHIKLFEYLFANHFDVYDLIPTGLAIDKRTIKP